MPAASRRGCRVKDTAAFVSSLRTKHKKRKKRDLFLGSQKNMVEFTDLFHLALPFPIVVQPVLHHLSLLGPDTELLVATSRISDGEHVHLVSFALFTARTALAMEDGALDQGTPQDFLRHG